MEGWAPACEARLARPDSFRDRSGSKAVARTCRRLVTRAALTLATNLTVSDPSPLAVRSDRSKNLMDSLHRRHMWAWLASWILLTVISYQMPYWDSDLPSFVSDCNNNDVQRSSSRALPGSFSFSFELWLDPGFSSSVDESSSSESASTSGLEALD